MTIKPKEKRTRTAKKRTVSAYIDTAIYWQFLACLKGKTTVSDGIAQLIDNYVRGNDCPDCIRNDFHCNSHKL